MDDGDGSVKPASFLVQLLTIVRDESPLVSMNAGELSIHDPAALERKMSMYFRHSKFSSFLRQLWEWAEVPAGEISPTFRELYKEHVGDRYGDADGSSRGRTGGTVLFGDPNALV